ncbi:hypothetical protein FOL47_010905, partial [Perkinsus chesapeaki]
VGIVVVAIKVKDVLIEDRAGSDCLYEDKEFISIIGNSVKSMKDLQPIQDRGEFKVIVDKILIRADKEVKAATRKNKKHVDQQQQQQREEGGNGSTTEEVDDEEEEGEERGDGSSNEDILDNKDKLSKEELIEEARRNLRLKAATAATGKQGKRGKQYDKGQRGGEEVVADKHKGSSKKNDRVWDTGKVNAETMRALDMSKASRLKSAAAGGGEGVDNTSSSDELELSTAKRTYLPTQEEEEYSMESDEIAAKDDLEEKATANGLFARLTRQVKNITGNQVLRDEDLEPVLAVFRDELMAKNVAMDVANAISDGVKNSLVGTRTNQFTSIRSTVKQALTDSISRILTPKRSVDVLKAATEAKARGEVYSIVFLGVNGVGKSTNLSKVAYYLRKKAGLKVLICACDTFRAGAVEQLKTHARCLNVELFERGYGKDAADIAKQGLYYAKQNGYDVVLIDTAGRMQDNEPLMKSLARLVAVNNPNLILFVGEALVGYDAIDQLTKFNRALMDYSLNPSNPRGIDGILLTKYDTVDDKVGAALSMVYITGQPIVFVGTGEKVRRIVDIPSGRRRVNNNDNNIIGKKRKGKLNRLLNEGKVIKSELSASILQNNKKIPGLQWSCEGVMDEAELRSRFIKQGIDNKRYINNNQQPPPPPPPPPSAAAVSGGDPPGVGSGGDPPPPPPASAAAAAPPGMRRSKPKFNNILIYDDDEMEEEEDPCYSSYEVVMEKDVKSSSSPCE